MTYDKSFVLQGLLITCSLFPHVTKLAMVKKLKTMEKIEEMKKGAIEHKGGMKDIGKYNTNGGREIGRETQGKIKTYTRAW